MSDDIEHGTYGGSQKCRRRPEGSCTPCKTAYAAYMADYRRRFPRSYNHEKDKQAARLRAMQRLAKLHPIDMRALYDEELADVKYPFTHLEAAS